MSLYIVYDRRANFDVDSACIMSTIQAGTDGKAIKKVKKLFNGEDCVLCDNYESVIWSSQW